MRDKWPYRCCFLGCWFQDLFNVTRSILDPSPSYYFSMRIVSIHVCLFCSTDTTIAWKKSHFILSDRSDLHMIDNQPNAVHAFTRWILTTLSGDETLLPRYVNLSTNSRGPPFKLEMAPSRLKHLYFFVCSNVEANASCYLSQAMQQRFGLVGVFARSAKSSVSSASVIGFVEYRSLNTFFTVKTYSLIISNHFWSAYSRQFIKI